MPGLMTILRGTGRRGQPAAPPAVPLEERVSPYQALLQSPPTPYTSASWGLTGSSIYSLDHVTEITSLLSPEARDYISRYFAWKRSLSEAAAAELHSNVEQSEPVAYKVFWGLQPPNQFFDPDMATVLVLKSDGVINWQWLDLGSGTIIETNGGAGETSYPSGGNLFTLIAASLMAGEVTPRVREATERLYRSWVNDGGRSPNVLRPDQQLSELPEQFKRETVAPFKWHRAVNTINRLPVVEQPTVGNPASAFLTATDNYIARESRRHPGAYTNFAKRF